MLDIKFIRENKDLIKAGAQKKHITVDIDRLITVDDERRELLAQVEAKRAEQNAASEKIAQADDTERAQIIDAMSRVKASMKDLEDRLEKVMHEWRVLMLQVPNIPDMSVPEGDSDAGNVEVRTWGEIPTFEFTPKSHIDLMLAHDMLDLDRGTKVSGFRGYFLKNDGALLQFALWQFVVDFFRRKEGYGPMIVPSLVRREAFLGTGYLPQGEDDLYKTQDGDFLAGTAEVATMAYFMNDTLEANQLPIKKVAFSPAFRREAGSHGKDTRGILRVHEFYKFEQVILCEASHAESVKFHEELTANAEEIMQALGLPYHVVVNCGGDLGLGQVKKYDIEAWLPSENTYRETHSSSYFHDFQARRLNLRYRDSEGKLKFVHSLNNTALSGRPLIMLVENYQQADGSILIPEVLRPYMGKHAIETRR